MKNRSTYFLIFVMLLSLLLLSLSACLAEETPPATETPVSAETAPATETSVSAETETEDSGNVPSHTLTMYCEKGEENGRPDMTHLFLDKRYESFTDEASGLRYHRLWRICGDCGAEVDFGTTRCKTNSHFCKAGCV